MVLHFENQKSLDSMIKSVKNFVFDKWASDISFLKKPLLHLSNILSPFYILNNNTIFYTEILYSNKPFLAYM